MRNKATLKKFFYEASKLAQEINIEATESCPRKVSRHIGDNFDNQRIITDNEEIFRVCLLYTSDAADE